MSDKRENTGKQRRNFFRRDVRLPIRAKLFSLPDRVELPSERDLAVKAVNLSGGGVLLLTTGRTPAAELLCEGALIDLSLSDLGATLPMRLLGRVVRVTNPKPDEWCFAVEFILITPSEADIIVRKVLL